MNNGAFKNHSIFLVSKLTYLLTDDLDIYSRLGDIIWRADSADTKSSYKNGNIGRIREHNAGISFLAALCLEYSWTKNWATCLDYQ